MIEEIVLKVLKTCVPVFALMGLGFILRRRGFISEHSHAFLGRFVFYFSLPVMVFLSIASSNLAELFHPAVFWITIPVTVFSGILFFTIGKGAGFSPGKVAVVSLSAFWGNTVYLGFPLITRAFGENALSYGAMMNAVSLPVFIGLGTVLLSSASGSKDASFISKVRSVVTNPIIQAVIWGILASFLIHQGGLKPLVQKSRGLTFSVDMVLSTARFLSVLGMPLALLVVGGAINPAKVRGDKYMILLNSLARLIVTPFISFMIAYIFFRNADIQVVGTSVLLMSVPLSVSACVISAKLGADEELVSATLVVSTVLSCLTLPVWIGLLLYFFG